MKKVLTRAAAVVLALLVFTCTAFASSNLPALDKKVCVVDDANILSEATESYITQMNVALASTGAQIGVLTVEYTGKSTTENYAYDAFGAWGIGDSSENNGVLLLLVPGGDDYWCVQGKGLETTLPTSSLSSILREEMEPSWLKQDYDAGTQATVAALAQNLAAIYGISLDAAAQDGSTQQSTPEYQSSTGGSAVGTVFMLLLIGVILFVFVLISLFSGPRGGGRGGYGGGGGGGFWGPFILGSMLGGSRRRGYYAPPPPYRPRGGFGGMGGFGGGRGGFGGGFGGGGFGGGGFGGGGFGGMGGGGTHGGGAGRGR